MAPAPRKPAAGSSQAEVVLLPHLKSCLVNLPASLVAVLSNANTVGVRRVVDLNCAYFSQVAQNVIVELNFRGPTVSTPDDKSSTANATRSVYLGWTGMQSQTKMAPIVSRAGNRQDQNIATVELDSTLSRVLGIVEGTKVGS